MKVAALQLDIVWENPTENFARVRPWASVAAAAGVRLLVLPEMFSYGFSMASDRICEPEGGASSRFLLEQAQMHGFWVCGSIPIRPAGESRAFNTLVMAAPDGGVTTYRKIHPFSFAREHEHYGAGDVFVTIDVEGTRCTPFICYDLRFADEFWLTASGTDCYLVVANWPDKRSHHWSTLLRARAIENQAYVVGVNRVGQSNGLEYSGDSAVIDPWGEVLAAGSKRETLLVADVDPHVVREAREKFPVMSDRRTGR